ncbi:MAG: hypothetical protein OQJ84_11015 [Xanthomonadales bacterium]|nr:hypothetical protein [Xanthomonadales bacterium]
MSEVWLVLKFGGTGVIGPEQWATIAGPAGQRLDDGHRVIRG